MKHARWGCLALVLGLLCLAALPAPAKSNKAAAVPAVSPTAIVGAMNTLGYGPLESGDDKAIAEAIKRFQLDNGLPATGKLDPAVIKRLADIGALGGKGDSAAGPEPATPPPAAADTPQEVPPPVEATGCPNPPDTFRAVVWPVQGRLRSIFGVLRNGKRNDGIDLAVPEGTAVRAIADGIVIYAGDELEGYGNLLLLRHAEGWISAYAYNKALSVRRGDTVCAGQAIALSGATGRATEPQLHFELRKGASPVDPLPYLPGEPPAVDIAEQILLPDANTEPAATPPPSACPALSPEAVTASEPKAAHAKSKKAKPVPFAALVWPARGRIITPYGTGPNGDRNNGIDLAVPEGTPVRTIADGIVVFAGNQIEGYGNLLLVRHADGWISAYANNAELLVARHQTVCAGQVIARSGATGTVTEPQLHFELRKGANPVNPVDYLP